MVRAPCCEKMGLKKGPWSPEEDHILINYIRLHGHGNWRALPKLAGLLRCGKSCRLRWTNYLRPDIKRGNFTREEEETIIQLHEQLGNRWSAIAAKLPGRTDNEIKNVWHTHLKKRVPKQQHADAAAAAAETFIFDNYFIEEEPKKNSSADNEESSSSESPRNHHPFLSPQPSSSDERSSITNAGRNNSRDTNNLHVNQVDSPDGFPKMDEEFWSEVLSADTSTAAAEAPAAAVAGDGVELDFSLSDQSLSMELPAVCDEMEFWYDLFAKAGELPEFSEF